MSLPHVTPASHVVPSHGCAVDTHVHVFDPTRFPYVTPRAYTPDTADLAALRRMMAQSGAGQVVIVQPSVYGTDNRGLLAAIDELGQDVARGVAVVDLDTVKPDDITALHQGGVRAVRLNLKLQSGADLTRSRERLLQAARVITRPDWHVQVHAQADVLPLLADVQPAFAVPLVLDHFAGLGAGHGRIVATAADARVRSLAQLLATGAVYVKLSAPYRVSEQAPAYGDLQTLAHDLMAVRADRLLWGSDWPHTGGDGQQRAGPDVIEPFRAVDVPAALIALCSWCPDPSVATQILTTNAQHLYGLPSAPFVYEGTTP